MACEAYSQPSAPCPLLRSVYGMDDERCGDATIATALREIEAATTSAACGGGGAACDRLRVESQRAPWPSNIAQEAWSALCR